MNHYSIKQIIFAYLIGASLLVSVVSGRTNLSPKKATLSYPATRDRELSWKFVVYTKLSSSKKKALLGKFAAEVQKAAHAQGYIIAYSSRTGEAKKSVERAKEYLVKELGLDIRRIVTVDCGHREKLVMELWITPAGAQPPLCYPTVEPVKETAQSNNSLNRSANSAAFIRQLEGLFRFAAPG